MKRTRFGLEGASVCFSLFMAEAAQSIQQRAQRMRTRHGFIGTLIAQAIRLAWQSFFQVASTTLSGKKSYPVSFLPKRTLFARRHVWVWFPIGVLEQFNSFRVYPGDNQNRRYARYKWFSCHNGHSPSRNRVHLHSMELPPF